MKKYKVLATPRSFAATDPAPVQLLEENDCEVIRLPTNGHTLEEDLAVFLPEADAIIAGLETYDKETLLKGKKLKLISRYGVGYDKVDLPAARQLGILVSNTPGANSDSVADFTFALMLNMARNICHMDTAVRAGKQEKPVSGLEVWGKTIGVIGTGRIGKGVVQRAAGFNMNILANDAYPDHAFLERFGGQYVDLDRIYREADFITIHAPLTDTTKNMINERALSMMKPTAVLINAARGGIVDEAALYMALKEHRIYGAALDATEIEPACGSPLALLDNCILTPHAGAATREASLKMGLLAAQNVIDVLRGKECRYIVNE